MPTLQPVQIDELPKSIDSFLELRDRIVTTPQGGAAIMVIALYLFTEDQDLGRQCLACSVDRDRLQEGTKGYQGWQLGGRDLQLIKTQLAANPHLPRSYVQGATPENGYQLPTLPLVLQFTANPYSGDPETGSYKVFVECSGASSPRPVTLRRSDQGLWLVSRWSSLIVGVQKPV